MVSGRVVYPETAGQNVLTSVSSHLTSPGNSVFLLIPLKVLNPVKDDVHRLFVFDVCFVMLREVVTPHETFLALIALKAFVS